MKMSSLFLLAALVSSAASQAYAGEAEDKIFSITSGVKTRYLADSGDLKLAVLDVESKVGDAFGNGTKCSKRRARDLSRAFRGVLDAAAQVDARKIFDAAKNLDYQANKRSKMYTKCWNHMVDQSKALGEVANIAVQVVSAGNGAGWQ